MACQTVAEGRQLFPRWRASALSSAGIGLSCRTQHGDAQPHEPHDLQQPEAVLQVLEDRHDREDARSADRHSQPAQHLGQSPGAQRGHAHEQDPEPAEKLTARACAEAVRHRLDRLPGRHGLSRIGAVKSDDRRHAGVEDHPARDEHDGPDEPHGRRRLGQDRGFVLQACVERQRQDGQDDAEDDVGDQMHGPQAALVADEQGHLLRGIHDALVLHERAGRTASPPDRPQPGRAPQRPRASAATHSHRRTDSFGSPLSSEREARCASRPDTYGVDLRRKYHTYDVSLSRGLSEEEAARAGTTHAESRIPRAAQQGARAGRRRPARRRGRPRVALDAQARTETRRRGDVAVQPRGQQGRPARRHGRPRGERDRPPFGRGRLEGGHAPQGDLGPGGLLPSPVGERL